MNEVLISLITETDTTRQPREGEEDGREYHFTDRETMIAAIENGDFIESTQFSGNYYGTSKKSVRDVQNQGRICILDVEIEGVKNLKKTDLNPRFVFVKPPCVQTLEARLRSRGTDSEEAILKRLKQAKEELAYGEIPGNFDVVLVNDDVEEAYSNLRNFILKVSPFPYFLVTQARIFVHMFTFDYKTNQIGLSVFKQHFLISSCFFFFFLLRFVWNLV
jgi:guanylate kinase